jgi:hypothetical protein
MLRYRILILTFILTLLTGLGAQQVPAAPTLAPSQACPNIRIFVSIQTSESVYEVGQEIIAIWTPVQGSGEIVLNGPSGTYQYAINDLSSGSADLGTAQQQDIGSWQIELTVNGPSSCPPIGSASNTFQVYGQATQTCQYGGQYPNCNPPPSCPWGGTYPNCNPPPQQFDFQINVNPSFDTVEAGGTATFGVTVSLTSGTPQPIQLDVSGSGGYPASYLQTSTGTPTFVTSLIVTTTQDTPAGTYTFTVTGTGGGVSRNAQATLSVSVPSCQYGGTYPNCNPAPSCPYGGTYPNCNPAPTCPNGGTYPNCNSQPSGSEVTLQGQTDPADVYAGESFTLLITASNNGNTPVRNVNIKLDLGFGGNLYFPGFSDQSWTTDSIAPHSQYVVKTSLTSNPEYPAPVQVNLMASYLDQYGSSQTVSQPYNIDIQPTGNPNQPQFYWGEMNPYPGFTFPGSRFDLVFDVYWEAANTAATITVDDVQSCWPFWPFCTTIISTEDSPQIADISAHSVYLTFIMHVSPDAPAGNYEIVVHYRPGGCPGICPSDDDRQIPIGIRGVGQSGSGQEVYPLTSPIWFGVLDCDLNQPKLSASRFSSFLGDMLR